VSSPDAQPRAETISVPIGRIAVAAAPAQIRTLLGSCIGLVLYDRVAKVGGVAHVVLPDSRGAVDQPGRFADTAVPALVAEMERAIGRPARARLVAKVAGGARMFQSGPSMNIGQMNVEAVDRLLAGLAIPIVARDVGGDAGRHLTLDTRSGIVTVRVPGGDDYAI
jgi:chemotaxis protein CheD